MLEVYTKRTLSHVRAKLDKSNSVRSIETIACMVYAVLADSPSIESLNNKVLARIMSLTLTLSDPQLMQNECVGFFAKSRNTKRAELMVMCNHVLRRHSARR